MGRTTGTPNKITAEVRGNLEALIEGIIGSIDINELDINQRIKVLQIALQYTLPRLQAMAIKEDKEDIPLFIEEIQIFERKEDSNEENWEDNFEVTKTYKTKIVNP